MGVCNPTQEILLFTGLAQRHKAGGGWPSNPVEDVRAGLAQRVVRTQLGEGEDYANMLTMKTLTTFPPLRSKRQALAMLTTLTDWSRHAHLTLTRSRRLGLVLMWFRNVFLRIMKVCEEKSIVYVWNLSSRFNWNMGRVVCGAEKKAGSMPSIQWNQ